MVKQTYPSGTTKCEMLCLKNHGTIVCLLLVIVCLCQNGATSQPADSNQQAKVDVGKEDPFSKLQIEKKKLLVSQKISDITNIKDVPELFIKTVTLKSLDAQSLKNTIEGLSSEYGRISIDQKSNSLIICDTKEYLERILAQICNADNATTPQQDTTQKETKSELLAETVILKFLDAKNLKAAIEKMSSERGSISTIEKSNSLIICDTQKNLEMILNEIKKIDKPTPGLFVQTITLKFLEAKNLKIAIDRMSSQYGSIATDSTTNSLIICDTKEKLEEIIAEIKKADRTPEQIMIEVVIIDVQLDDDTEIGVNWDSLFETTSGLSYEQALVPAILSAPGAIGGHLSYSKNSISGAIHALKKTRDIEILASPRVLVVSGQSALIQTTEEIPYTELTQSSGAGGDSALALTSTQFKDVGITLKVKATLADDQKILLAIEPEQSINTGVAGVGGSTVPIVDKRKAQTTLLMEDGQVLVMGGLRKKETRLTKDKVPLIGDLPLIGFLFSNNKKEINHSELLVLISPHIYKNQRISEDVMEKFNELKDRPMLQLPKDDNAENEPNEDELLSVLTLLDEKISQ
jgi:general secretion pathway protein D